MTRDDSAPVQTSVLYYTMEPDPFGVDLLTDIDLTYRNGTTSPVYYDRCSMWLEYRRDGKWTKVFSHACVGGLGPLRIDPGGTFESLFVAREPFDPNASPRFATPPVSGVYRIIMQLHASTVMNGPFEEVADPLPVEAGRSNEFWIEVAPH